MSIHSDQTSVEWSKSHFFRIPGRTFDYGDIVVIKKKLDYWGEECGPDMTNNMCGTRLWECDIKINFQPEDVINIPIRLHSDVPYTNNIDVTEDYHSFSCDIYADDLPDYRDKILSPENTNLAFYFKTNRGDRERVRLPPSSKYEKNGNSLKIDSSFFQTNIFYFICQIEWTSDTG
jgi:hypothetical protein